MRRSRRSSFVRYFLLPFAMTSWLGACHKWVPLRPPSVELPAQASMPVDARDQLRLHVGPGGTVEGTLADLTEDTVVLMDDGTSVSVPLEDVARVDARRPNPVATVALVVVGAAATLGVAFVVGLFIACSGGGCG